MGENLYRWRTWRRRTCDALGITALASLVLALTGLHVFYVVGVTAAGLLIALFWLSERYRD